MPSSPELASSRQTALALFSTMFGLLFLWSIATPATAGPDEPDHQVRAAALIRGQLDGEKVEAGEGFNFTNTSFEVPSHIGTPRPDCYRFASRKPATCALELDDPAPGNALIGTRSWNYPIWGHLAAGIGTLAPKSAAPWATRMFDGLIPVALLAASLAVVVRRGWLATASFMMAATPMVWFVLSVTNPSGLVIAGGFGLWAALLDIGERSWRRGLPVSQFTVWLGVAGWAAMVLPRRDGMFWAMTVLAAALLVSRLDLKRLASVMGRKALAVAGLATLATLIWAATSEVASTKASFLTPGIPAGALVLQEGWRRLKFQPKRVVAAGVAGTGVVGLAAMLGVMSLRGDGFDGAILKVVIQETTGNVVETIGNFGWLDTPFPTPGVFAWMIGLGMLAAVAVIAGQWRLIAGAVGTLGVAIAMSWTLTMLQNDTNGLYFQGRYYLPVLVGVPLILGAADLDRHSAKRLAHVLSALSIALSFYGLAVVMRRFGVGTGGSVSPLSWDTYGSPLPPVVILLAYAALGYRLFVQVTQLPASYASMAAARSIISPEPKTDSTQRAEEE